MSSSWAGGLSESFSEASKRLSAAVAPHLHELSVDGMFPADAGRPAPPPPAALVVNGASVAATDSGVFTIDNAESPTPPTHAAARAAPASARPEGSRSSRPDGSPGGQPSLAELHAAELRASSLQSEVDATKLKALTKIRAQDEQLRRLRAALDGAEAQRRRLEVEAQRHKLEAANAAAATSAATSASTSSAAQPAFSFASSAVSVSVSAAAAAATAAASPLPPPQDTP